MMTLKLHSKHLLLKGPQPTRRSAVTKRIRDCKVGVMGDAYHSQGAECHEQGYSM